MKAICRRPGGGRRHQSYGGLSPFELSAIAVGAGGLNCYTMDAHHTNSAILRIVGANDEAVTMGTCYQHAISIGARSDYGSACAAFGDDTFAIMARGEDGRARVTLGDDPIAGGRVGIEPRRAVSTLHQYGRSLGVRAPERSRTLHLAIGSRRPLWFGPRMVSNRPIEQYPQVVDLSLQPLEPLLVTFGRGIHTLD